MQLINDHLEPGQYLLATDSQPGELDEKRLRTDEEHGTTEPEPSCTDSQLLANGTVVDLLGYLDGVEFKWYIESVNDPDMAEEVVVVPGIRTALKP